MKPNYFLSVGFLLLCASIFMNSLTNANAYPQGPNVSLGQNPIDNYSSPCNSWDTLFTNNTNQIFTITDVVLTYTGNSAATLRVNGQYIYQSQDNYGFISGLKIQPGETVECSFNGNRVTISGYYTH